MSIQSNSSSKSSKVNVKRDKKPDILAEMNGKKKMSDYIILTYEKLGEGAFSKVYACINKHTHKKYAIKLINLTQLTTREKRLLSQEIWALDALKKHEEIITLEGVFKTKKQVKIVQEFCEGGDLYDYIWGNYYANCKYGHYDYNEEKSANIILQLAIGINNIHKRGITHRDLKPENILFKDKKQTKIKIIDFGLSGVENQMTEKCGTSHYIAPEILIQNKYDKKCDYWSLGCILYALLSGQFAFSGLNKQELYDEIKNKDIEFNNCHWKNISKEAKWLILGLLNKNPLKRYGYKEIIQHPWIIKHCPDTIINLD